MADPLSITASIITLIQASIQVTVLIKQFHNEASAVDATLTGLLGDVEGFKRVLESMRETVGQSDIKSNLQLTGHTGCHWKNLARSLHDGTDTLQKLHNLLDSISKKTSVLDAPRKLLRLKSASEQIAHYREQIQSSHTALQLSLSTIILWNQVTFQKSTERIPDQIVPTLDKLYEEFRIFGALLNAKIEKLQYAAAGSNALDNHKLQYMNNLRECVRSAADVVSTASTTLNTDSSDNKASVKYGSEFGDVFIRDANEPMLRWFASNTVYEFEDVEAPLPAPSEASTGDALTEYNSDTDSDLENDLIRSLFKEGQKRKEQGDLTGAVRHFRNCLTRFSSNMSYASLTPAQSSTACGVSKVELLEHLTDSYCLQGSWSKAKSTMAEKLVIMERQVGKKDGVYLQDTMKLAEIMMMNQDYVEAHLQARRSLRGFRKLGENGHTGYENCLAILINMCQLEGKEDEEEAYTALLVGHASGALRVAPKFKSAILSPDAIQPQPPSTTDTPTDSIAGTSVPKNSQEVPLQSHETTQKRLPREDLHATSSFPSRRLSVTDLDNKSNTKGPPNSKFTGVGKFGRISIREHLNDMSKTKEANALKTLIPAPGMAEDIAASTSTALDTMKRVQDNKYYAPLYSFTDGKSYPTEMMEFIYTLSTAARQDRIKRETREAMVNIDFLETYCRISGKKTHYSTFPGPAGFTCTLHINGQRWCTVSGYAFKSQAVDAAAAKACREHMTSTEMVTVMEILGMPNRSSDKEVYIPDLDENHIEITDDTSLKQAPGITITQPGQDTVALRNVPNTVVSDVGVAERSRLRRYASDSSILTEQDTDQSSVGRFLTKSFTALMVGNKHQRAAASLSKLPSNYQASNSSSLSIGEWNTRPNTPVAAAEGGSSASPRVSHCPICNNVLSEVTYNALSHVNKCIAEQYGTIDMPKWTRYGQIQSPGALVSRSSSYSAISTSTEGLWACDRCRPGTLQYLNEERCGYCSEPRGSNAPSSLNGFECGPFDYFQRPLDSTFPIPQYGKEPFFIRRKVVLLGDALCGKTYLASTWSKGRQLSGSEDTMVNTFIKTTTIDDCEVELVISDCNGTDENETMSRLSFDNPYMLLICFDISNPNSFANVEFMWRNKVKKYLSDVPKVLVGCKKDLRDNKRSLQALLHRETLPISPYAGNCLAIIMGALAYFETSAIKRQGLSDLFDYVAETLQRLSSIN